MSHQNKWDEDDPLKSFLFVYLSFIAALNSTSILAGLENTPVVATGINTSLRKYKFLNDFYCVCVCVCVFRCPWLAVTICPAVPTCCAVLFLFVLANFTMATFMDAGVLPMG